jgi:D-alanyl-D-alanine carboxypeptidase (penicillin-binding protein 5/6)
VLSIHWITKLSASDEPDPPVSEDPIEKDPPIMQPSSQGQSWSPDNADATMAFVSDAAIDDFLHVTVNGAVLHHSNYTVSAGSTIVTLKQEYLASLTVGTYTIGIHSQNGVASTSFEIKTPTGVDQGGGDSEKPSYIMDKTGAVAINKKTDGDVGIYSKYAILVDLDTNKIVAERNCDETIYPASMTKVMTLLVACEQLQQEDMNRYVTMSADVIADMNLQGASMWRDNAGNTWTGGEELRVIDLLYAVALESDCAASIQLAVYVAGSHEAFVQMMNDKVAELGLLATHFVNATGLHDNNHYTTSREMASIMAAAMDNEQVKTLLSSERWNFSTNIRSGRFYSTYFVDLYNYMGKLPFFPDNGKIVAAKTGLTDEAGYCLATYMESASGGRYVVITAKASSQLLYVEDYRYIYGKYAK